MFQAGSTVLSQSNATTLIFYFNYFLFSFESRISMCHTKLLPVVVLLSEPRLD